MHLGLRNQGIGTKLLSQAEKFAKDQGYQIIYLHTSKNNPQAVKFWHKNEYQIFEEDGDLDLTVHMDKKI